MLEKYHNLKVLENNIQNDLDKLSEEKMVDKAKNLIWAVNQNIDGYGSFVGDIFAFLTLISLLIGIFGSMIIGFKALVVMAVFLFGGTLGINALIGPQANEYNLAKIWLKLNKNKKRKLEKELALVKRELKEEKAKEVNEEKLLALNEIDKSKLILAERLDLLKRYTLIRKLKKMPREVNTLELDYLRVRK